MIYRSDSVNDKRSVVSGLCDPEGQGAEGRLANRFLGPRDHRIGRCLRAEPVTANKAELERLPAATRCQPAARPRHRRRPIRLRGHRHPGPASVHDRKVARTIDGRHRPCRPQSRFEDQPPLGSGRPFRRWTGGTVCCRDLEEACPRTEAGRSIRFRSGEPHQRDSRDRPDGRHGEPLDRRLLGAGCPNPRRGRSR